VNTNKRILDTATPWMIESGPQGDVVLSSRVRLARNLKTKPFPTHANATEKIKIRQEIMAALPKDKYNLTNLEEISSLERELMMEGHLISPQIITDPTGRGVAVSKDKLLSIMINEEDHLRIQAIAPGLDLDTALTKANKVDDSLEEKVDIAFDEQFGYLTAWPTNLGTGLRVSAMLHLPGLALTNNLPKIFGAVSQLGMVVRGIYGEGTEALGNLYQVSNQRSLGRTEDEFVRDLDTAVKHIIGEERKVREALLSKSKNSIEDKVRRSLGVLKEARLISTNEALALLSNVRLGIDLDLIDKDLKPTIQALMQITRPAHLQKFMGNSLEPEVRDFYRATVIREELAKEG